MKISPELNILIKASLDSESNLPFQVDTRPIDWQKLGRQAKWNQVRPLAFDYLSQKQTLEIAPDVLARLRDFSVGQAVTNMAFSSISVSLNQQLAEQGIPAFLMKGALWAWLLYEKPGLREFGDIDFFVEKEQLRRGLDVFEKNGFEPDSYRKYLLRNDQATGAYLDTDYQLPLTPVREHALQSLEIQWNCSYPRYQFNFSWGELGGQMVEQQIMGKKVNVPGMEHQLIMMLIHHAGIEQWDKLKYMADFVRLLRRYSTTLDWAYVSNVARSKGFYKLLLESLGAAQLFTGIQYVRLVDANQEAKYPTPEFMKNVVSHWEEERDTLSTKTLRILVYNLKYRDNWNVKWNILAGHLSYLFHWRLIWHKWIWHKRR
ncbi:nucleotidyltransferase domain-containing protein, partial [Dyadobacter crusticola]|uniref:nucleotidyltransferase domain-containing protein n=1 Tax=Dyadobacter crusticola TaxID=292407 RepID=UPI0004E222CC